MGRQSTIRDSLVRALRKACDARGWTDVQLARRMGVHRRTVTRAWRAEAGLETLEAMADALDVDLDSSGHLVEPDRDRIRQVSATPVVGWSAAADVLGVSTRTLARVRAERAGRRRAWWKSPRALLEWFDGVVSLDESTG